MTAPARVYAEGRAAHPTVEVSAEAFEAFVRERLDPSEIAGAEISADLYLACACLHADEAALAVFDATLLELVPSFVARIDASADVADEVKQRVRERLFVARGEHPPKIAEYRGRGRLASWLRVVAVRTALNLKASARGRTTDEGAADALLVEHDPELDYLRARYRAEFHQAFVAALASLEPRARTVLRLHLIDGMNIDALGQTFGVHRATAARWIGAARDTLFERTRDELHAQLGLSEAEFASLVRLVRSQLDISICRILREHDATG